MKKFIIKVSADNKTTNINNPFRMVWTVEGETPEDVFAKFLKQVGIISIMANLLEQAKSGFEASITIVEKLEL